MNIQMLVSIVKMRKAYNELIVAKRKEGDDYDLYRNIVYESTLSTDKEGTYESSKHVPVEKRNEVKQMVFTLLYLGVGKKTHTQENDITDGISSTVIEIVDELLVDLYAVFKHHNKQVEDVSFGSLLDTLTNNLRELLRVDMDERQEIPLLGSYDVKDMREYMYRVVLEEPSRFQMFCKAFWQDLGNTKHTEGN